MAVKKKINQEKNEGLSLDDAFADDEDVDYAKTKPLKSSRVEKRPVKADQASSEIGIRASKPAEKIKKGDKIKVDGLTLEVDAHYVLMDHKTTKEMVIECFDSNTDKDYQIRYFSGQVEKSLEVYKLEEIVYSKISVKRVEW